jgi:hypothetical protein
MSGLQVGAKTTLEQGPRQGQPRPPLHERGGQLTRQIDGLDETLRTLRDKLEPVLLPDFPHGIVDAEIVESESSWLADYLDGASSRIRELTEAVGHLLARIDV